MECAGADLLDIGGESTRPGSAGISAKEELARVVAGVAGAARAVENSGLHRYAKDGGRGSRAGCRARRSSRHIRVEKRSADC